MTTKLKVDGMTCDNCVRHVREALEGLDGVQRADVRLGEGIAIVEHDGGDEAAMVNVVEEEGYSTAKAE
jgi:copper chaperone